MPTILNWPNINLRVGEAALLGAILAEFVPDVVGHAEENFDDARIELATGPCCDFFAGGLVALPGTIGAIGSDGVERVGDGEDAGAERNFFGLEAARVAGAVKFFLMAVDDFGS